MLSMHRVLSFVLIASLLLNAFLIGERFSQTTSESKDADRATTTVPYQTGTSYPLLRIVDGDTMIVGVEGKTEYVRFIGVDTPEPNDSGGPECYALEATQHLRELVKTSGTVTLHFDSSQGLRDTYGRLLAYVEHADGTDLGEAMIRNGYAQEHTYDLPYERQKRYQEAETDAMQNTRGLWSDSACGRKSE
jgi:micrococcal nuclease